MLKRTDLVHDMGPTLESDLADSLFSDQWDELNDSVPRAAYSAELRPTAEDRNTRLDKFIAAALPDLSRSYLQTLIEDGNVLVDGIRCRVSFKLTPGEVVFVRVPAPIVVPLVPQAIPLDILFEDNDVIVLCKPSGLVVHPAPGHPDGTLVNALLAHAPGISVGGTNRPGIVHRLDKDTSGLMVIAKTDRARTCLVEQWQRRSVRKRYVALVAGRVEFDEATIDAPIGRDPRQRQRMAVIRSGREAITHLTARTRFATSTLLDIEIETGRTHQIRVHLTFIGHPVVGDEIYGRQRALLTAERLGVKRLFLHAAHLGFSLPGGEAVDFDAPLPDDLRLALARNPPAPVSRQ